MLPKSYDRVSEETKQTVQLFIARASGFLQGKGNSGEEVVVIMDKVQQKASTEALEMAVTTWKASHQPCTAEQFVQRFADLVWEGVTSEDDRLWPYDFKAPVHEGPLSTEFLETVGITEEEARGSPEIKKEQKSENKHSVHKQLTPVEMSRVSQHLEPIREEQGTLRSAILDIRGSALYSRNNLKRKNIEPENTIPKRPRGNDGGKDQSASSSQLPTSPQWSGVPLTEFQVKQMDAGLMETIWESRIYGGDNTFHDAGVFAVKIPKNKAWQLLGKHISQVQTSIWSRWRPLKLYTCDLGHTLQVGLWIPKNQGPGRVTVQEMVRYQIEELYNILRHWSFQVQGGGTQSLANCLAGYLKHCTSR